MKKKYFRTFSNWLLRQLRSSEEAGLYPNLHERWRDDIDGRKRSKKDQKEGEA